MQALEGPKLDLDVKLCAQLRLSHGIVVGPVHSPEVNEQGLINEVLVDFKFKNAEVEDCAVRLSYKLHLVVHFIVHFSHSVGSGHSNLKVHRLGSFSRCFKLWLLEHDFEEARVARSELNDVVIVVVHSVDVCQVEVSRLELPMV